MRLFLKILFISAMFAGSLISCMDNIIEDVNIFPAEFIGFTTTTTRASSANLSVIQKDKTGFRVFATGGKTPVKWYSDGENGIDGFNHHRYSDGKWGFDRPVKWSKVSADYPKTFYAYYPASSVGFQAFNETFSPDVSLTALYTVQPEGSQEDLLVAKTTAVTRPASGTVGLVFHHILSKINFGIISGAGSVPYIQSLQVVNAKTQRGFDFVSGDWYTPAAGSLASYLYYGKPPAGGGAIAVFMPTYLDGSTANPFYKGAHNNNLMLMPQTSNSWKPQSGLKPNEESGGYVCLIYRMNTDTCIVGMDHATQHPDWTAKGAGYSGPLFVKAGFPLPTDAAGNFTWQKGYGYLYNIVLGTYDSSNGYILDENYYDENGDRTDLPLLEIREEYKLPGDPLNDGNIHFILNVVEWDKEHEEEVGNKDPDRALFELGGVASGATAMITYTNNSSRTTTVNNYKKILAEPSDSYLTIESLSISGGAPILIGRKGNETVSLKFNNGNLVHRDAALDGMIPIGTYSELQLINTAAGALEGHYKQEADIQLMDKPWTPIGKNSNNSFTGIYDGNGHAITGLSINNTSLDNAGLFGYVGAANVSSGVFNLGVSGSVTGRQYVGGIVGYLYSSTIANCFAAVDVTGAGTTTNAGTSVGGIAGQIYYGSHLNNSYSTGNVTGIQNVGGIVGLLNSNAGTNISVVENCYATGAISGNYLVAGVVGQINQNGLVRNCVALNKYVKGNPSATSQYPVGRVFVRTVGTNNSSNNHAWSAMGLNGGAPFQLGAEESLNGYDGISIPTATLKSTAFWTISAGWDTAVWTIKDGKLPGLFNKSVEFPGHIL